MNNKDLFEWFYLKTEKARGESGARNLDADTEAEQRVLNKICY